jgi:uncharacterized membrane protein
MADTSAGRPQVPQATMSTSRLESFSDGVIAVAITLLILDLHVPNTGTPGSLARHLGEQWPNFAAYVASFLTIGVVWINHHTLLGRLARADHFVLMLNIALLMTIVVLPFTTSLMSAYLTAHAGQHLAAVIYGGSFLLFRLVFLVIQRHLLTNRTHLMHQPPSPALRRAILRRTAIGVVPYLLATLGGLLSPYLTLAIVAAVALFYAVPAPDRRVR